MKKSKLIFIALFGLLIFFGCEEEERGPVVGVFTPPSLSSPSGGTSYVLTEDDAEVTMATFTWSAADFGFSSATSYTVQLDKTGGDFSSPIDLGTTSKLELVSTVGDVNGKLLLANIIPDISTDFDLRVRAVIHAEVDTLFSSIATISITPYDVIIIYPSLYIPGNYQAASGYGADWSPADAPEIYSLLDNNKYEGYVYMEGTGNMFKFTDLPNWDVNWGDNGADGTLDSGGSDISAPAAGYYKLNADINALTYTVMNTDWGLIGSATPGGWDSDQNMTYDKTTREWSITLDLVAGDIKFRANDAWDLDYGDNEGDLKLDKGGSNIAIAADGNYTITLKLEVAPYKYSVTAN
jgi:hypothetical protein